MGNCKPDWMRSLCGCRGEWSLQPELEPAFLALLHRAEGWQKNGPDGTVQCSGIFLPIFGDPRYWVKRMKIKCFQELPWTENLVIHACLNL